MRRVLYSVLTVGLLLGPSDVDGQFIPTFRQIGGDTTVVSVSETGEVRVPPARAIVFVTLTTDGVSTEDAATANAALRATLTQRLVAAGVGVDDISLWGYAGGEAMNGPRGVMGPGGMASHQVKSGLRLTVEPVDRMDSVAAAIFGESGSSVTGVQMEAGDAESARSRAVEAALRRARAAAEAMAAAAGGRLGKIVQLTSLPDYNSANGFRMFQSGGYGQGVQLFPSDVIIRANVLAAWTFEPSM